MDLPNQMSFPQRVWAMASASLHRFSVQEAREIVKDLFVARSGIYWADMIVCVVVGYGAAVLYLRAPLFSAQQVLFYFVAGFTLFRLGSFIHEIVHMSGRQLMTFRVAWNILAGIPMLMPSFFYSNHIDHHTTRHYGTGQDGEYLPLGSGAWREVGYFYLQVIFLPIAVLLRFLVLTPISFLHPRLRQWTLERASSFVINLRYRHRVPANAPRRVWATLEWMCFLWVLALVAAIALGVAPWTRLPKLYCLAIITLGLNYVRNLVAHHYRSPGQPISHKEQLADSVNITGVPLLTELFFPLGLRFHALHHLFPSLPYHSLARAHRRLMAQLPADSAYRDTVQPGYWSAVGQVVTYARRSRGHGNRRADAWYARRANLLASWDRAQPVNISSSGDDKLGEGTHLGS
jgi:fatty acid desaturase